MDKRETNIFYIFLSIIIINIITGTYILKDLALLYDKLMLIKPDFNFIFSPIVFCLGKLRFLVVYIAVALIGFIIFRFYSLYQQKFNGEHFRIAVIIIILLIQLLTFLCWLPNNYDVLCFLEL